MLFLMLSNDENEIREDGQVDVAVLFAVNEHGGRVDEGVEQRTDVVQIEKGRRVREAVP